MRIDGFDWGEGNRATCEKHGVSIAEIVEAPSVIDLVVDDPFGREKRYRTVGRTRQGRHIFAVLIVRNNRLRPISIRYMHQKEVAQDEKEMARLAKR